MEWLGNFMGASTQDRASFLGAESHLILKLFT